MRKSILSLVVSMLLCSSASAQFEAPYDCCYEECPAADPFYAALFGGANFLQTKKNGGIKYDYQTGYIVSGSLGYRWCYGLRLEGEYAYRRNSLDRVHFFGRSFSMHGHLQSSSFMANVLWDLPLSRWGCECWGVRPFIGAGIGCDCQQIKAHSEAFNVRISKTHFAWQVIAGIDYSLFCNTDISLKYQYHQGGFSHIHNHSLGIGLTYKFGFRI